MKTKAGLRLTHTKAKTSRTANRDLAAYVNPARERRSPAVCADGRSMPPTASNGDDRRLKAADSFNGINAYD